MHEQREMEWKTSLKKGSGDINSHNVEDRGREQHVGGSQEMDLQSSMQRSMFSSWS